MWGAHGRATTLHLPNVAREEVWQVRRGLHRVGMFVPPTLKHPVLVGSLVVITNLAVNLFGCFPIFFVTNREFIPNSGFCLHVFEKRPMEK